MYATVCLKCGTMVQYPGFTDGRKITCYECGTLIVPSKEEIAQFKCMVDMAAKDGNYTVVYDPGLES